MKKLLELCTQTYGSFAWSEESEKGLLALFGSVIPLTLRRIFNFVLPQGEAMKQGIEAVAWTGENKGLAGLGDLNGLPWMLNMEELFESYVEAIFEKVVQRTGGLLKSGDILCCN